MNPGLCFRLMPGLTLLRGGEGRGKTTLLRLLAGELAPFAGALVGRPARACFPQPSDPASDEQVARAWLVARLAEQGSDVSPQAIEALAERLGLTPHLDKPKYMLSTGSRRKLGIAVAALAGAPLTLLDQPFAALDARSCRLVADLLAEASGRTDRCWVIADHERPHWLDGVKLAGVVELGE
ncbi:ABC transporter ATP-binding protein [Leptothrix sp. BB-4]